MRKIFLILISLCFFAALSMAQEAPAPVPTPPAASQPPSVPALPPQPTPATVTPVVINPPVPSSELPFDVQILVDFSGSMKQAMGASTKIAVAREALTSALADMPPDIPLAFRAYGQNFTNQQKEQSCKDSVLVVPYAPATKDSIIATAASLVPKGMTPIAYSLELAGQDVQPRQGFRHTFILVSDGEETCGGDPVATVKRMREQGLQVTVQVIGFDVDPVAQKQLQGIADAGGGKYYDARDAASLVQSLKTITQEVVPAKQAVTERLAEARLQGGDNYETAVAYPSDLLGREVNFENHIMAGAPEFFSIDVKPGYALRITAATGEYAVKIDPATREATELPNVTPRMDASLEDSLRKVVKRFYIYDKNSSDTGIVPSSPLPEDGGPSAHYYILVGRKEGGFDLHKNSFLKVELIDQTDAGSGADAPDDVAKNPPLIEAGKEYTAYFSERDRADVFKISQVTQGETVLLSLVPQDPKENVELENILDVNRVTYNIRSWVRDAGAPSKKYFVAPLSGDLFIKVRTATHSTQGFAYTIKWETGVTMPAEAVSANPKTSGDASDSNRTPSLENKKPAADATDWKVFLAKPVLAVLLMMAGIIVILLLVIILLLGRSRKKS